jgi:hypothetical protein
MTIWGRDIDLDIMVRCENDLSFFNETSSDAGMAERLELLISCWNELE